MLHSVLKQASRAGIRSKAVRSASTAPSNHAFVQAKRALKTESFYKKNWLSDPSTYPLIATMGLAFSIVTGVAASCIFYNPDVQINPEIRGSIVRPKKELPPTPLS